MTRQAPSSALVRLLEDSFGAAPGFPQSCWITWALAENQADFSPALDSVLAGGAQADLVRRLREEHPAGRAHLTWHDYGLLNAFTEAEAFAWAAYVANLPTPSFNREPGTPDLKAGTWWIEAKTINKSAEARAFDEAVIRPTLEADGIVMMPATTLVPPSQGLTGKFQSDLEDAIAKWNRQERSGQLIVFYDWVNTDFGVSRRQAQREVIRWAEAAEQETGVKIVIAWNYNWQVPLYQTVRPNRAA